MSENSSPKNSSLRCGETVVDGTGTTEVAGFEEATAKKGKAFLVVKVLGSGVLLYFLFRKLDVPEMLLALRHAHKGFLALALLTGLPFLLTRAYKWFYIVRAHLVSPNFGRVLVSYMFGLGIGIFTPGRIGEVARIANIGTKEKLGPAGLFLFDKFVDVLVVFSMALFGVFYLFSYKLYGSILALALFGALLAIFFAGQMYEKLQGVLGRIPLGDKLGRMLKSVAMLDRRKIAVVILLTLVSYTVCVFQVYFILRAFCNLSIVHVLAVHPLVMTTNILPITFGGLGLREGASVFLYSKFGIMEEHAFWGGFLIFAFVTFLYGALGIILSNFAKGENETKLSSHA
jgi:uncharacterized protein (TIRG00374 family)